jgi:uncharacterized protein (DUF2141 family)
MKSLFIALALALGFSAQAADPVAAEKVTVTVKVNLVKKVKRDADDPEPKIYLSVFNRAAGFPDDTRTIVDKAIVKAVPGTTTITLQLEPGTYAIAVFHDEDGDGKLDTFMKAPTEQFGFSRDPKIGFGAPDFRDCAFKVESKPENVVQINLKTIL